MKLFGLIGDPVKHSVSPAMHSAALDAMDIDGAYIKKKVGSDELIRVLEGARGFGFDGLNVTIPHKRDVVGFCDELGTDAGLAGAVNTICFRHDGVMGYNTDVFGAWKPVDERMDIGDSVVAVAGAGGAARAVSIALRDAREIFLFNRTLERAEELSRELDKEGIDLGVFELGGLEDKLGEVDLFVDATSVGLEEDKSLVGKGKLFSDLVVFDLVYKPLETKLVRDAKEVGCDVILGYEMLVYQGAKSLEHWLGREPPLEAMKNRVLEELEK